MGAGERRDDALRDRLPDAEGIADGEHDVTDLERVGIRQLEGREGAGALEAQHGQIGARVAQHDLRLELALVAERDLHVGHALDDVVVGHDEARGIDDDARAERLLHAARWLPATAEELAEDRIVEERVLRPLLDARGIDVDDGGRRPLHHRGIGIRDLGAGLGHGAALRAGGERKAREESEGDEGDTTRHGRLRWQAAQISEVPRWMGMVGVGG